MYDAAWYDERWNSMPPVMRKLAADTIKKVLDEETVELIRAKHAQYGYEWIHHLIDMSPQFIEDAVAVGMAVEGQTTMSGHHIFGTQIRNLLRNEEYGAGIRDDDLPGAEWVHATLSDGSHPIEHNWHDEKSSRSHAR